MFIAKELELNNRLLLILSAICSKNYSSYEKSLGKYIPPPDSAKNPEGSVFGLQSAKVSAITSSVKTPNQAETVQIRTRTAKPIWAGPTLALTCTLFDK